MFKKIFGGGSHGGGGSSSGVGGKKVSQGQSEKNTQNVINAIQQLQDVSVLPPTSCSWGAASLQLISVHLLFQPRSPSAICKEWSSWAD